MAGMLERSYSFSIIPVCSPSLLGGGSQSESGFCIFREARRFAARRLLEPGRLVFEVHYLYDRYYLFCLVYLTPVLVCRWN